MASRADAGLVVRFSVFELNQRSGELRKSGLRIPLQDQPLELLKAVLERPGELVTREELRQRLWHDDTFVDFDDGLNAAVRRLRDALGDNATTPRFIETLPRRGYRFIAPIVAEVPPVASAVAPDEQSAPDTRGPAAPFSSRLWLWWALPSALAILIALMAWRAFHTTAPMPQPAVRFSLNTQPLAVVQHAQSPAVALSPDGTHLAYVAGDAGEGQLYLRNLSSLDARPIAGAEQVQGPFFSPDGEWLAFFGRGNLQKISLRGGSPSPICTMKTTPGGSVLLAHGASWGDDGSIVFENEGKLWHVKATGGTPTPIAAPGFLWPQILPGSRAIVATGGTRRQGGVWVLSLDTGEARRILPATGIARYVRSGHLVYAWNGSLLAAPFDLESLDLTGPAVQVVQHAMMGLPGERTIVHFAVSGTGTLAYLSGPLLTNLRTPIWVSRDGREEAIDIDPRIYEWVRLSPDGSRLALAAASPGTDDSGDVWIYDLARRTLSRLTLDPALDTRPLWTPDAQRLVFTSRRDGVGRMNLFWKAADGTSAAEQLTKEPNPDRTAYSFTADGKTLAFVERTPGTGLDVHLLRLDGPRRSEPLLQAVFNEGSPAISPDDRWIAYRSNETGRYEIYVRPFPDAQKGKWPISTNGGNAPVWSPSGRELFYDDGKNMMVTAVQTTDGFTRGTPKALFTITGTYVADGLRNRQFDVSRDGRRFIMIKEVEHTLEPSARDELTVVLNWFEELRQVVPTGK